jgi:hypothetical protein
MAPFVGLRSALWRKILASLAYAFSRWKNREIHPEFFSQVSLFVKRYTRKSFLQRSIFTNV